MDQLDRWIGLLLPIVVIDLGLRTFALWDILKRGRAKEPRWVWMAVAGLIGLIGPAVYFLFGREEG